MGINLLSLRLHIWDIRLLTIVQHDGYLKYVVAILCSTLQFQVKKILHILGLGNLS